MNKREMALFRILHNKERFQVLAVKIRACGAAKRMSLQVSHHASRHFVDSLPRGLPNCAH